ALGITLPEISKDTTEIPSDIQAIADARWDARSNKDWATSDQLRDELATKGWTMKDGKDSYELSKV
ncbi:MAG: cysteine--tRNA ligase, partial [Akkermansiaceae bacterium]